MAITIDWASRVINVPKADMLLVQTNPIEIRELDLDIFRLTLKSLEDDPVGMMFPDTHRHNTTVTVSGITLARVIEIINGYTVTFEDGSYAVNLVGANSNVGDVVNLNSVSVRSANSAGLTYSKEIEDQSFHDARVWIDTIDGQPGTQYPAGTPSRPVDNWDDAHQIQINRSLPDRYHLKGTLVVPSNAEFINTNILGTSPTVSTLVFSNGQDVSNATIRRTAITGNPSGVFSLQDGFLSNVSNFEGDATNTGFTGIIQLPAGTTNNTLYTFHNCFSVVPGTDTPILDCNNIAGLEIQLRGWTGGIEIRNYSGGANNMSIDLVSGHVKLHSSVTAGTIVIRGDGHITDNSTGATVTRTGLSTSQDDKLLTKKEFIALK